MATFLMAAAMFTTIAVVAMPGAGGFLATTCANHVLDEVTSPDGLSKAVVFERDCGPRSGYSTQVSLLDGAEALGRDAGELFAADTGAGKAPSGPGGGPEVRVSWQANDELVVGHHVAARVFVQEERYRGVIVRHRTFD